jgi:nicotinate dehydrogenase subunit B
VQEHFLPDMPIRVSAMRSLGAYMNVFAIESFMDELATSAHVDPVEFRLRHLDDPRARDVIHRAANRFGWKAARAAARQPGHGVGFAFAMYKNLMAYCAIAVEVVVERDTGNVRMERAACAVDCGQIVNPDGARNQVEGGILQSSSWTLFEQTTFDTHGITSFDWSGYPILRFSSMPKSVEVELIDRPGTPFLGVGEASQGPTSAALANAVSDAVGKRIRDLPLAGARLRNAALFQ